MTTTPDRAPAQMAMFGSGIREAGCAILGVDENLPMVAVGFGSNSILDWTSTVDPELPAEGGPTCMSLG